MLYNCVIKQPTTEPRWSLTNEETLNNTEFAEKYIKEQQLEWMKILSDLHTQEISTPNKYLSSYTNCFAGQLKRSKPWCSLNCDNMSKGT